MVLISTLYFTAYNRLPMHYAIATAANKFHVRCKFGPDPAQYAGINTYDTFEEAAAWVSYLNGGIHPDDQPSREEAPKPPSDSPLYDAAEVLKIAEDHCKKACRVTQLATLWLAERKAMAEVIDDIFPTIGKHLFDHIVNKVERGDRLTDLYGKLDEELQHTIMKYAIDKVTG